MQFLILAHDATDADAINRRMAERVAHINTIDRYHASGNMHMGAAICDDHGKMVGSVIICEFESRKELDDWLRNEPYIQGKVWDRISIQQVKIGPSFLKG